MNFIIENKTKYIIWTFFNYLWNYSKILSEKIVSWAFFYKASVSPSASRLLRSLVDPRARSLRRHAVYARDDASNAGPKPLRRATGRPLPPVTSSLVCALSADGRGVEEGAAAAVPDEITNTRAPKYAGGRPLSGCRRRVVRAGR